MSPQLSHLTFRITASSDGYKSIKNIIWEEIPAFSVLTGRNGSGKSQLLFSLDHLLNRISDGERISERLKLQISGDTLEPGDVAFVANSGEHVTGAELSVANLKSAKDQLYDRTKDNRQDYESRRMKRWVDNVLGVPTNSLSKEEFAKRIPNDFIYMLEEKNVIHGLVHVFLGYRLRFVQELEKEKSKAKITEELGPAPWDVLNEILSAAEFPYRVAPPYGSLLDTYKFELKDQYSGFSIPPNYLSSGEKVILQLALWFYNSKNHGKFPKLFLLDEPDAHLHPSMTRQFMSVIKDVLVDRYGSRVIMTTHSPSTVALAPDGSVFEMSRGSSTIEKSRSKAHAIGLLTAGLIVVSPTTRTVIVEDEDDVKFYEVIRTVLSDYGPSKDNQSLDPAPSIIFLPASSGKSENKIAGGKDPVRNWVAKFDAPPFEQLIFGLIDKDTGNFAGPRILVNGRHSIENYEIDPFVVFGLLSQEHAAPTISGISVSSGDEHSIRELSDQQLQSIVDFIQAKIEPKLSSLSSIETALEDVIFTNGRKVKYPNWMLSRRGHDLLTVFQSVFGGPKFLNPPKLLKVIERVRLIPEELAQTMHRLQKGS